MQLTGGSKYSKALNCMIFDHRPNEQTGDRAN